MVSKIFSAGMIGSALLLLNACDTGPKDIFSDAEISGFIDEFEETSKIAKSTRGDGKPLMWTLSDDDTDIHMFGTIHLLPPGLDWRSDAVNEAFADAHTLVTEVTDIEGEEDASLDMLMSGMSDIPLKERLSEGDYKRVAEAADSLSVPMTSLDLMKPWMAALTLEIALVYGEGFDDTAGVEVVLEAEARRTGKKLAGLETSEFQQTLFDKLSERAQLEYLVGGAVAGDMARDGLNLYLEEWLDGDFAGMNALSTTDAYEQYEGYREFYNLLLTSRNEAWIPQIEAMLDTPGTIFIAVGAGHLEGPDSVILMLREKGYEVEGP